MKEKTKMIAGEHYNPLDPQLIVLRDRASRICHRYNKKFSMKLICAVGCCANW
ncbi:maltose acetyltransferase domain-containing protein [Holdemania massiliensis]|uniref:maltose acetyltransferase domain-containing protein n=1 Tax=Holdemania massiliensis TaxID=1468449 RepID=UPI001F05EB9E|nr:maltose acetyltransferase domain-containing protein [Holdemania massiliensis]MCH1940742.1 hypothetical protein [Holdemania massiliensis]